MKKWFRDQPEEFYTDVLEKRVEPWRRCIELEEHYVEKQGIATKESVHSTHSQLYFVFCFI
jgi:hypothetical protein